MNIGFLIVIVLLMMMLCGFVLFYFFTQQSLRQISNRLDGFFRASLGKVCISQIFGLMTIVSA
jgi:hypothetical protein